MTRLVVIGCGAAKLDRPTFAAELYTGQHFRACLSTARALAADADIRILSAKYGLLELGELVGPYDLTIGEPGAITAHDVAVQAWQRGYLGRRVLALCSARYAAILREVFADVDAPLSGLGIGWQRHALAELRRRAG